MTADARLITEYTNLAQAMGLQRRTGPVAAADERRLLWLWLLYRSLPHYYEGELDEVLERGGVMPQDERWRDAFPEGGVLPPLYPTTRTANFVAVVEAEYAAATDTPLPASLFVAAASAEVAAEEDSNLDNARFVALINTLFES